MKSKKTTKVRVTRTGRRLVLLLVLAMSICMSACNVTRKVTTESSYFNKGDTTTTIIVKTIESYDATKRL